MLYEGIWEEGIVKNAIKAAKLYEVNPIIIIIIIVIIIIPNVIIKITQDAVLLDLGSNLGVYSLLVAQLRHSAGDQRFDTFYLIMLMLTMERSIIMISWIVRVLNLEVNMKRMLLMMMRRCRWWQ